MSPQSSSSEDEFFDAFPHAGSASGAASTRRLSAERLSAGGGTRGRASAGRPAAQSAHPDADDTCDKVGVLAVADGEDVRDSGDGGADSAASPAKDAPPAPCCATCNEDAEQCGCDGGVLSPSEMGAVGAAGAGEPQPSICDASESSAQGISKSTPTGKVDIEALASEAHGNAASNSDLGSGTGADDQSGNSDATRLHSVSGARTSAGRGRVATKLLARAAPAASPQEAGGAPWGGVFSALGSLRSGLYGLVEPEGAAGERGASPAAPETVPIGEENAMQRLVADLAPPREASLLDGIDRTVEYATGKLGRAIAGSFRSFGYALETVSPPAASPHETTPPASPAAGEQAASIASSVVSAGITTLGRIGRRTAGIVSHARGRLAQPSPYVCADALPAESLRRPWDALFGALGGPAALEALQVRTSAAAVESKRVLRGMSAADAARAQERLRAAVPVLDAGPPAVGAAVPWGRLGLEAVPEAEAAALAPVVPTPEEAAAAADALRACVTDSPVPPDATSLLSYLARRRMAVVAAAYVRALFCVSLSLESSLAPGVCDAIVEAAGAALGGVCAAQHYARASGMLGAARQEALVSSLSADVAAACGVVRDATALLESSLRLAALRGITSSAPRNIGAQP